MFDPNFSDDDVVHATVDVVPRINLAMVEELDGAHPLRLHFEGFGPKADFGRHTAVEFPVGGLRVECGDGRMVRDLRKKNEKKKLNRKAILMGKP